MGAHVKQSSTLTDKRKERQHGRREKVLNVGVPPIHTNTNILNYNLDYPTIL